MIFFKTGRGVRCAITSYRPDGDCGIRFSYAYTHKEHDTDTIEFFDTSCRDIVIAGLDAGKLLVVDQTELREKGLMR